MSEFTKAIILTSLGGLLVLLGFITGIMGVQNARSVKSSTALQAIEDGVDLSGGKSSDSNSRKKW